MRKSRRSKNNADTKGIILIGIAVMLISMIIFFMIEQKKTTFDRNDKDMCRTDGYQSRETAIIVDATDNFSESQAILIKKEIQKILEDAYKDERFTVYVLDQQFENKGKSKNEPLLAVCNPGDGSDASDLTQNKRRLLKKWEQNFYDKLYASLDKLIGEHSSEQSPIMEMIKFAAVNTMYYSSAKERRLILISDMLHHTTKFSQYSKMPNFKEFKKTPYYLEINPELNGVGVEILYLVRPNDMRLQNYGHIQFWKDFVESSDGSVVRVKTVN